MVFLLSPQRLMPLREGWGRFQRPSEGAEALQNGLLARQGEGRVDVGWERQ